MATRRAFLAGLASAALPRLSWADVGSPAYLAAGKTAGGGFVLQGLGGQGASLFQIDLPARGHAAAAHPHRPEAVAFARRPGTFAVVIGCATGIVSHQLTPPEGNQFNGHGAFSADGSLLMTSEVVAETSDGRIGLWDTQGYTRIGQWSSGGIGPHEIKRLPDGRIVVANGGIRTDPRDRTKLNIADMRPNLTLLSGEGVVLDQVVLDPALHQNSIRHLALSGQDIAFAMQWEGDKSEAVPQLGLWAPGSAPRLCPAAEEDAFAMQGYAGSIAAAGGQVALTSPVGGVVQLYSAAGAPLKTLRRADICGVAPAADGFIATDGQGAVWACTTAGLQPLAHQPLAWDNHLIALG